MPKKKSNSGASKRLKMTASGKLKRKHAFKNHILTKKDKKRKRHLTNKGMVHERDLDRMLTLLSA